ncbi:MAG: hypothetical protein GF317_02805 [Candidatus Lokiarchaeota archaeon]|nr:hypothetical protein [Candidatus Lokiarchaeota archaeon]MBD3198836.1 hypothetical protein [Candidatus Lokiarchaeota archaeon]
MKILVIISSYRKNGHTSKVVDILREHLHGHISEDPTQVNIEKIFLGDYKINHCMGCRLCMEKGEEFCPLKDDVPILKEKMKQADAVVFASPVYVGDVSSSMKALIDRFAYMCHRQEFYKKYALILATTNATSLKRTIRTIGAATYSWGFKTIGTGGFKTDSSNDSIETIRKSYNKKIRKLAKRLIKEFKKKGYLDPSIISLAAFKIQQKARANPEVANSVDYKYWDEKGWRNKDTTYYIDVETGIFKKFAAKMLYGLLSIVF